MIGTTAVACVEKAKEMDRSYHVQENISSAASNTYHAVRRFEEDYKVSERVVEGVKTAASTAARAEEDYQITARVRTAYKDSIQYATEMEERSVVDPCPCVSPTESHLFWRLDRPFAMLRAPAPRTHALHFTGWRSALLIETFFRYELRKRAAEALNQTWETAQQLGGMAAEYDREYKITENAAQAIQDSFYYVVESAKEASSSWSFSAQPQRPAVPPNSQI